MQRRRLWLAPLVAIAGYLRLARAVSHHRARKRQIEMLQASSVLVKAVFKAVGPRPQSQCACSLPSHLTAHPCSLQWSHHTHRAQVVSAAFAIKRHIDPLVRAFRVRRKTRAANTIACFLIGLKRMESSYKLITAFRRRVNRIIQWWRNA